MAAYKIGRATGGRCEGTFEKSTVDGLERGFGPAAAIQSAASPAGRGLRQDKGSEITRALDNGASLREVQIGAGHADARTTKLYHRRGYNPEKSVSFLAS